MPSSTLPVSSLNRKAVYFALLQQVPFAMLCLLMLDFGRMAKLCGIAMVVFWTVTAVVLVRRPLTPGRLDLLYLRWGFWPVLLLTVLLAQLRAN
jgi:hypothetical protein